MLPAAAAIGLLSVHHATVNKILTFSVRDLINDALLDTALLPSAATCRRYVALPDCLRATPLELCYASLRNAAILVPPLFSADCGLLGCTSMHGIL